MIDKAHAFFHWLGTPFRALGNFLRALVNLTRTQMRAIFSLGMLGGIIALSFQNLVMLYWVYVKGVSNNDTLFAQMALSQQFWNNVIMAGFATIVGLVVFGADWLRAKYGGLEFAAGKGEDKTTLDVTPTPQPETAPTAEPAPTLEDAP